MMKTSARSLHSRFARLPVVAAAVTLSCSLLAGCVSRPASIQSLDLERRPAQFSLGRMTVVVMDEYGITMPGMRVDLSWDEPSFYRTSAFTNRQGEVSFSGVPEVAEVSINHPGGIFSDRFVVPQSGRPELRLMLDTMGGGEMLRQQERERLMPRRPATPAPAQ
jgi:hypothetical protein